MPQISASSQNVSDQVEVIRMPTSLDCHVATVVSEVTDMVTSNGETDKFAGTWPTSFSKGLPHDEHGIVDALTYTEFLEEITDPTYTDNTGNRVALFDTPAYRGSFRTRSTGDGTDFSWRAWESAISTNQLSFGGADSATVGIAPAPRLGSDELAAEMAELYAMAHLRDVPLETIRTGDQGADKVAGALANMAWFQPDAHVADAEGGDISKVSAARRLRAGGDLNPQNLFRGSSQGCADGPYLSQFLLQGLDQRVGENGRRPTLSLATKDGFSPFGAQRIDQRIQPQVAGVDYLRDWAEWLDVQNGADTRDEQAFDDGVKFIETPRDLATLVHYEAVYQAYINACHLMLSWGTPSDDGLPQAGRFGQRDPYASWGGPHVLTLLTETANRALRAVRQHTFQTHNRARPEKLGSIASLVANGHDAVLGAARDQARVHLDRLDGAVCDGFNLMDAIASAPVQPRFAQNVNSHNGLPGNDRNLLLPVAYAEGSPMHPSYGAGHAAVAGACVTVLKAFFRTHSEDWSRLSLADAGAQGVFVPASGGRTLVEATNPQDDTAMLTLNGDLNKLAANISIGRNMAGVHYYSDYFDSVRMGERIAVGILAEQMATCSDSVRLSLETFDGDRLIISGTHRRGSEIRIQDSTPELWWTRHLPEQAGW